MGVVDSHIAETGVWSALDLVPQASNPDAGATSGNGTFWVDAAGALHYKTPAGVDAIIQSSINTDGWAPVRVATAAALPTGTYSSTTQSFTVTATGTLTVDGVLTALGDRILVQNQATASQNGIYVVTTAGAVGVQAVLTRALDANVSSDFFPGKNVGTGPEGTLHPSKSYFLISTAPITLDTTNLIFALPFNREVVAIPVILSKHSNGSVVARFTPGFIGNIVGISFSVTDPVTTGSKLATFAPSVAGTPVTGGLVALTSANCTPVGAAVAGSAITALNAFTAAQEITVVASSVTAFVEGQGVIYLTLNAA